MNLMTKIQKKINLLIFLIIFHAQIFLLMKAYLLFEGYSFPGIQR